MDAKAKIKSKKKPNENERKKKRNYLVKGRREQIKAESTLFVGSSIFAAARLS